MEIIYDCFPGFVCFTVLQDHEIVFPVQICIILVHVANVCLCRIPYFWKKKYDLSIFCLLQFLDNDTVVLDEASISINVCVSASSKLYNVILKISSFFIHTFSLSAILLREPSSSKLRLQNSPKRYWIFGNSHIHTISHKRSHQENKQH